MSSAPVSQRAGWPLLKFIPTSTIPAAGDLLHPQSNDENQLVTRVDWQQSAKHSIFGRYFIGRLQ